MTMLQTGEATAAEGLIKDTTTQTFVKDVIEESKRQPVLVDFWAEWCGPCRALAPKLEGVSGQYADSLRVVKLNVDEAPSVAQRYGIRGIPTLILFQQGEERARIVGAVDQGEISRTINPHITTVSNCRP